VRGEVLCFKLRLGPSKVRFLGLKVEQRYFEIESIELMHILYFYFHTFRLLRR